MSELAQLLDQMEKSIKDIRALTAVGPFPGDAGDTPEPEDPTRRPEDVEQLDLTEYEIHSYPNLTSMAHVTTANRALALPDRSVMFTLAHQAGRFKYATAFLCNNAGKVLDYCESAAGGKTTMRYFQGMVEGGPIVVLESNNGQTNFWMLPR